jgi:RHS repeat-associated protein
VDTGSKKSPGKINGCFFQGLDYYPYGMEMPGRTFTAQTYRYAYQGSEQASEYNSAGGNVYTTFFRTLDSRLGRWHTPDVVSQPWQSPYCSMDNNPVALVDPWGAESEEGENSFGEPILDYEFQSGPTSRIDPEGYIHTVERKGGVTYDVMYKIGNENDKIYFHLKMEINDEVNTSQSDNNEVEKPYYTPDQGFAWYSERGINGDNPYADVWRYLDFDLLEIFNLVYSKISKLKISRTKKTKNTKNSKESKTTNKTLEETKRTTGRSKERQPSITKKEPATTTVVEEKIENTNRQVHGHPSKRYPVVDSDTLPSDVDLSGDVFPESEDMPGYNTHFFCKEGKCDTVRIKER